MKKFLCLGFFFWSLCLNAGGPPLKVVATFSILSDLVQQVGKENVVVSIVGPNSDAHIYEPTPQDVRKVAEADIIFKNGLSFEGWMDRLLQTAHPKASVHVATRGIKPRHLNAPHEPVVEDPHAWHDVQNAMIYIENIASALGKADPKRKAVYEKNKEEYLNKLRALDAWIMASFKKISPKDRRIITAHDAFGYFGERYGIEFLAPVGISTEAEPTVRDVARMIDDIKRLKIKVIFVENISNPKMIQQISEETGAKIGGVLYSDALSDQTQDGSTYIAMIEHNVRLFLSALQPENQKDEPLKDPSPWNKFKSFFRLMILNAG